MPPEQTPFVTQHPPTMLQVSQSLHHGTKSWRSWHSPAPAARRGQSCGFGVTAEPVVRPVLHWLSWEHMGQAPGIPTSHPSPSSPRNQTPPKHTGTVFAEQLMQTRPAINSATATTKFLSLTRGYFHLLQGPHFSRSPRPHFSMFCTHWCLCPPQGLSMGRSVTFIQSHAPDSHTAHPTAAPALAACPTAWARVTPVTKAGSGLTTRCGYVGRILPDISSSHGRVRWSQHSGR